MLILGWTPLGVIHVPDLDYKFLLKQGKKNKVSTSKQTWMATNTLSKAAFLLTVLSERLEYHNLAFRIGMFALELQRPPASTKALEVQNILKRQYP